MSLDALLLRTAAHAVASAGMNTKCGRHDTAREDARLAIEMLQGALREDDYESELRRMAEEVKGDSEPRLSCLRDLRPMDEEERLP